MDTTHKPVHTLVLDTGAIIKNDPVVSTLLATSEALVTVPAIISEIRDAATRSRVETTLLPFLTLRSPSPASVKLVTDFARRTGDLAVLSKPDIQIIALTYEIECERNRGDWRLRSIPGQKRLNGPPPSRTNTDSGNSGEPASEHHPDPHSMPAQNGTKAEAAASTGTEPTVVGIPAEAAEPSFQHGEPEAKEGKQDKQDVAEQMEQLAVKDDNSELQAETSPKVDSPQISGASQEDSDSEGWITPSNLKKRQAEDADASTSTTPERKNIQVGVLTTDFAMQNVILQMNLNLLSRSMTRVKHLKTFVLRCHACFQVTKETSKQFCPRCGQPALTRVSCSTNANGEFKLHLKKNMQWNTRGDRYSIPKPVHGAANGRVKGGGKGHWGNDLILAEDQKEYERAVKTEKKQKERSLMDEDYLPSILTGDRGRAGGRTKVGAGRNVNARKR